MSITARIVDIIRVRQDYVWINCVSEHTEKSGISLTVDPLGNPINLGDQIEWDDNGGIVLHTYAGLAKQLKKHSRAIA